MKVYVVGGGGLGDLIREYFGGQDYWGYLKGIKEKYPGIKIKATLCIHNPQAKEFLKYNPYLEKIEQYPWQVDGEPIFLEHSDDYVFIRSVPGIFEGLEYVKPEVYLNEKEEALIETIKKSGKYIFIHPFAGLKDRVTLPIEEYPELIDSLIGLGYNVVVVGGSYKRMNRDENEEVEERFEYEKRGLFNLVGKVNSRIATKLVQKASGFIGTHSCYILVASIEKIKSVLIVPERIREYLNSGDANAKIVRNDFTKTIYINGDVKGIKKEIMEWIKLRP